MQQDNLKKSFLKQVDAYLAEVFGDTTDEILWQLSTFFTPFKFLHKVSKLSYQILNNLFTQGFGPAKMPLGLPVFFGLLYGIISFIVRIVVYRVQKKELPKGKDLKDIFIKAALGIMDTCVSMLFWEAGYSLGALVLIPLLLTPFGLGGFAAAALSIIICALTAGLGIAIWNFIDYAVDCFIKESQTFSWKNAAKLCSYGFVIGANFVICTFLLLIPGGKQVIETLLDVTVAVITGLLACIVSFFRERTRFHMQNLELSESPTQAANLTDEKIETMTPTPTMTMVTEVLTRVAIPQVSNNTNVGSITSEQKETEELYRTPSCSSFPEPESKQGGYVEQQNQGVPHQEFNSTLTFT